MSVTSQRNPSRCFVGYRQTNNDVQPKRKILTMANHQGPSQPNQGWHGYPQQPPPQYYYGASTYSQPYTCYPTQSTTQGVVPPPPAYPLYNNNASSSSSSLPQYPNSWNPRDYPIASPPPVPAKRQKVEYRCETCNVTMDSEVAWRGHLKSHIRCSQCDFVASPKVIKAHHQSVHGKFAGNGFKTVTVAVPGCPVQRFRICVGDHPDDIRKWLAERRKRFPRQQKPSNNTIHGGVDTKKDDNLGSLLAGYGSSSDDDDDDDGKDNETTTTTTTRDEAKPSTTETAEPETRKKPCRYFMRNGRCRNGDACKFSHDVTPRMHPNSRAKKSNTPLLRKLLQTDMERESNLTLQLLRYIVDCNYLQEQRKRKP